MKKSIRKFLGAQLLWVHVSLITGCSLFEEKVPVIHLKTKYGTEVAMGNGKARSFVRFENGIPISVGISLSKNALENLPHENHTSFLLDLPEKVEGLPFDHFTADWEFHGHDPAGVYDLPHFDFHFYMISKEQRMVIGSDDPKLEKEPDLKYIPEDYFPTPGFPQMGKHWLDGLSHEWHGQKFTETFIFGTYDGKLSFFEPMITLEFLQSAPNLEKEIRQPEKFDKDGFFPTKYAIEYDKILEEYRITLLGLVMQSAS